MALFHKIRKEETRFDFQKAFNSDFLTLKFLGMYFLNEKPKMSQKIYSLIISFPLVFLFNLVQIINLFYLESDLKKLAASGYVVAVSCMATVKSFYLFKHRQLLINIANDLRNNVFQPKDRQGIIMATKSFRAYHIIKTTVLVISSVSLCGCMTTPVLIKKSDQILPTASWYPFEFTHSPVYEIVYFHQCISVIYVTYINVYSDIMVAAFSTFVGLQCDLLCQNMITQNSIKSVNEFVSHHKCILQFAKNTEALISEIYFFQFSASTLALCMTLFLLTVIERNSFEFFYLLTYQAAMACLLLVPCWFSSEMQRKSQQIPLGVYSLLWTDATHSVKKDVQFFIQRVQHPITFHVLNLFPLSVDTFLKIVRSSFSYYTVLNNLNMKNQANN